MIRKILIANRGEIACRVIRTASKLGLKTVAIFSSADKDALHVKMADEAIFVGEAPSKDSYLRSDYIIEKALENNVDAIHPGYGFLSENASFAEQCVKNGIVFIGPPPDAIRSMGSKSLAKQIMQSANVPLVPGYHGDEQSLEFLKEEALKIGYPVLLKAAAGGGGKGMRVVTEESEFEAELTAAKRESMSSFGDNHMLVEKYLTKPRHIEIQVFCDSHGNAVYLFERDCSIQRRHQKIIEEAPAPNFPDSARKAMGEAAIKAALAIDYQGAGTVEFLYDVDGSFYFMEMNTRLQVEHPVTEKITGLDLVEWQISVANGLKLPLKQEQLKIRGHAIEARIYAEDPDNDFLPSTGDIQFLKTPDTDNDAVRIDTGIEQGNAVSVYYDPMISKLITFSDTRDSALSHLENALQKYCVSGVKTNISYLLKVIRSSDFANAVLSTNFVSEHESLLSKQHALPTLIKLAAFSVLIAEKNNNNCQSVFVENSTFRLNHKRAEHLELYHNYLSLNAKIEYLSPFIFSYSSENDKFSVSFDCKTNFIEVSLNGITKAFPFFKSNDRIWIFGDDGAEEFIVSSSDLGDEEQEEHSDDITAPMNGTVVDILVTKGQKVEKNQTVAVIEAMKMEQSLKSPRDGVIAECYFSAGDRIDGGIAIVQLEKVTELES